MHDVRTPEEIKTILGPGGAMEAFEAAKKAGKCRFIGFTGHFDPETLAALLKHTTIGIPCSCRSMPPTIPIAALKRPRCPSPWKKASPFRRSRSSVRRFSSARSARVECLAYTLSMPVHVAVCGAGTQGQMEDNIRVAQSFKPLSEADLAAVRQRAIVGQGVYTGTTMEYWKKPA